MAKYYGSVEDVDGYSNAATRRGHHGIRAAARTYDGSLIAIAEDDQDSSIFRLEIAPNKSSSYGKTIFIGSLADLEERLAK